MYTTNSRGPRLVGMKAVTLSRLARHFSVPEFVVVSSAAYREFEAGKTMSHKMKRELERNLERFLKKGPVAVRSSCTAEDLPGISFAGIYTTTLNVRSVDEGIAAIKKVWASAQSPRAQEYCHEMKIATGDMAVIIQHQLNPEISGVMVTQSPFSVSEVMIECCTGLGDKLVSGAVSPMRYRIRDGKIIEQKGSGLLTPEQLSELLAKGKRIERILGTAQDIEWALEGGRLYILQARPVFLNTVGPRKKGTVWCNANVRETIPDPISPMTWSIFDNTVFPGIMIDVMGFPMSNEQYRKYRPVEMLSGRLYWNMNNTLAYGRAVGPLLDFMKGDQAIDPQMAAAFKAVDLKNLPKPLSDIRMFFFTVVAMFRTTYYLSLGLVRYGWMARKVAHAHETLEEMHRDYIDRENLIDAVKNIQHWMEFIMKKFARRYFGGIVQGGFNLALLSALLSMRMGRKGEVLARKTMIGIIDKTGEMAIGINGLAALARQKLRVVNLKNLKKLYDGDRMFHARIKRFLEDFGNRGPGEFDLANLNWREDHDMLFNVIAAAKDSREYAIDRAALVHAMLRSVRPYERFLLKAFIPRFEVYIPLRENGKHVYLKAIARVKDQLNLIARSLVRQGLLRHARDVYFLTLSDIERIGREELNKKELTNIIAQRKRQWKEYSRAQVPDIIYESGERISSGLRRSNIISGEPLSVGKVRARARIIADFSKIRRLRQGEILVTHHADPGWTPLFTIASGLIVEVGGVICHAAMVARELGIPALSVPGATSLIRDGAIVELDADEGRVKVS